MPVVHEITTLDMVELIEPVEGAPPAASAAGSWSCATAT